MKACTGNENGGRRAVTGGAIGTAVLTALLVTLPAVAAAQADLQSDPQPDHEAGHPDRLDELVVTGSIIPVPRRQIGTAVSVIDGDEIELRGYHAVADVLRTQPGIGVTNAGGHGKTTTLRIRGEEAYRTLLMIDGVKAVDPSGPQVAPVFDGLLTTSDLGRVEVLRGPQGFIYGADAGGVVNVISRRATEGFSGRAGLEYGRHASRKYEASFAGGNDAGDYYLSMTDFRTDGFNSQTSDTTLTDDDGAENTTVHMRLGWNAGDALRLQLVARDIDASAMYDGCFSTVTFAPVHDCVATTGQTTYRISADHDSGDLRNLFAYSHVDVARDDFSEGQSAFATRGEVGRLEYTGSYSPAAALTLVYGLDFQTEEVAGDERLKRDQRGYYLEYRGEYPGAFGNAFHLTAGARYDDNEDFGSHTSLRVSGAYIQELGSGDVLKYRASVGTGFRAPSLFEIAYNSGPWAMPPASLVTLHEETSRGYDIGVEYAGAAGLHLELTYFDQKIEDEIFFDLAGFSGYLQSPGRSESTGVELGARAPLGARWEVFGNWTYNETADTDNERRLRRPRNLGNLGVLYAPPGGPLRLAVNYRLSRGSLDVGGVALDDYRVVDISSSYRFSGRWELHARLENATDEDYQELVGYNTAGRAAYAGLRLRF